MIVLDINSPIVINDYSIYNSNLSNNVLGYPFCNKNNSKANSFIPFYYNWNRWWLYRFQCHSSFF